jgi:glucokinase
MAKREKRLLVLAGDIGGTKTRLGLFTKGAKRPYLKVFRDFPSKEAANLEEIIERFLENHPSEIAGACFGIAGPVENGRCKTTNLPWEVVDKKIKKRFDWPRVRLLNDVEATVRAVPLLTGQDLLTLNAGKAIRGGNIGLVAPGTGLGEALMTQLDGRRATIPTEGGHADFAPGDDHQVGLWRHLRKQFDHVSNERVVSGPGLFNIYAWLRDTSGKREPPWLSKALEVSDPPKVIAEAALQKKNSLCVQALDTFISIFGSVCGNLALTGFTTGGMYLGGGIPPKILPALEEGRFMETFTRKGRFKAWMTKIPVRVILNDKTALLGAAACSLELGVG